MPRESGVKEMSNNAVTAEAKRYCPAHVPKDMVRSLDTYNDPRMKTDPIAALVETYQSTPISWNDIDAGFRRGCWVVTRAEDQRKILMSPDFQNNNYVNLQALVGERWPLIPTGIDGEIHKKYRTIMAPWFTAQGLAKFESAIDQRAEELVDQVVDQGGCEFMEAFATRFPISIFLELAGLPVSRMEEFLEWEYDMLSQSDFSRAAAATEKVLALLRETLAERRAKPRNDLISTVAHAEIDGRPLNDEEMMGMVFGFYLGGLDTVTTSLGMHFHELATNQLLQQQLREHPEKINTAVEELLRRFSPTAARRQAMKDYELHGVTIKAGDWVQLPTTLGSLDPDEFPDPLTVDIERQNKRHLAFVTGIHFCLGHVLARRELQAALRIWLTKVPPFRIARREEVEGHGGVTVGWNRLPLAWD
jgi:cytochrome P450